MSSTILDVNETTTGDAFTMPSEQAGEIIVVVTISGTVSVDIQGKVPGDATWFTLLDAAITASKGISVRMVPEIRAVATVTSGTARVTVEPVRRYFG